MRKTLVCSISLLALALCAMPAVAQQTFFDDFSSGFGYNPSNGWTVSGQQGTSGTSFTAANEFTAMASGSVSQIDIGIGWVLHPGDSFYAALYTVNNGLPGTELFRADNLTANEQFGGCCGVTTITGITGLNLTAGEQYYLVIGPQNFTGDEWLAWNLNNTGATGTDLVSTDNGETWASNGTQSLGAFDILGGAQETVPEPSSLLLLGTGLVGAFSTLRKKISR